MSHNSNIAKNIKLLRLSKELTIKQLSEKVSIGVGIYGFYETERANVPLDNLIKIADFHSVKLDDLIKDKIGKQLRRKIVSIEYRKQKEVLAKKRTSIMVSKQA
jgi:transcriptional regulator with XRE-family HTH domain